MKRFAVIWLSLLISVSSLFAARKLSYDVLPPTVKETIDAQNFHPDKVKAELDVESGHVVYKVTVSQPGRNPELWIASDGSILNDSRQPQRGMVRGREETMRIGEAPLPVQNAVKAELGPVEFGPGKQSEVRVERRNGTRYYHVRYHRERGLPSRIVVREDGFIVASDRRVPGGLKQKVTEPGNQVIQLSDLPAPARQTVQREAGSAQVGPIVIESAEGQNIFRVEMRQAGQSSYLWVEQNGNILKRTEASGALK